MRRRLFPQPARRWVRGAVGAVRTSSAGPRRRPLACLSGTARLPIRPALPRGRPGLALPRGAAGATSPPEAAPAALHEGREQRSGDEVHVVVPVVYCFVYLAWIGHRPACSSQCGFCLIQSWKEISLVVKALLVCTRELFLLILDCVFKFCLQELLFGVSRDTFISVPLFCLLLFRKTMFQSRLQYWFCYVSVSSLSLIQV